VSRVLYREYRFSAYEIYLRRSFAPGSLLNEVSKRTGWTTEVHRVGVTSGSSIVIFEAYGGGSEFATASRRILPLLPPSPPLSLKHSILIQHLPGVRWWRWRVCACVHAAPAAELIIKRLRGISVKTARHDVVDGVVHVATNVRGITSS